MPWPCLDVAEMATGRWVSPPRLASSLPLNKPYCAHICSVILKRQKKMNETCQLKDRMKWVGVPRTKRGRVGLWEYWGEEGQEDHSLLVSTESRHEKTEDFFLEGFFLEGRRVYLSMFFYLHYHLLCYEKKVGYAKYAKEIMDTHFLSHAHYYPDTGVDSQSKHLTLTTSFNIIIIRLNRKTEDKNDPARVSAAKETCWQFSHLDSRIERKTCTEGRNEWRMKHSTHWEVIFFTERESDNQYKRISVSQSLSGGIRKQSTRDSRGKKDQENRQNCISS